MRRAACAVAAGFVLALAGCGGADPDSGSSGAGAAGDTRRATLVDRDGDGTLERGPGEPLRDRGGRGRPVRTLATFVQLTDAHVRDEESPGRVPFLDRLGSPFSSTFRPQEALGAHVLTAAVAATNALRPDAVLQTGDLIDNAQRNELRQALAALRGGTVRPDSGARGPSGPQLASNPDPFGYRPDVDAPRHPGLLARAQRPFRSPGLRAPLHHVPGNHDLLVQGELAPDARTDAAATGSRAVISLDPDVLRGVDVPKPSAGGEGGVGAIGTEAVRRVLDSGETARVAPDPQRRAVTAAETSAALRGPAERRGAGGSAFAIRPQSATPGLGGPERPRNGRRTTQGVAFRPILRVIALDLVDRRGGSAGLLGASQRAFLAAELRRAGRDPVVVVSHQPLDAATHRALARRPTVIAAISGHTHRNRIRRVGGLWTITTASLADFPSQARAFALRQTGDGRLALETWMLDHGPGPEGLAATARELAFLDAQGGRPKRFAGQRTDRNVRLWAAPRG